MNTSPCLLLRSQELIDFPRRDLSVNQEAAADQTPLVIRYGCTRGQRPPRCRGDAEAKERYNPLFIGTLEKHPRFSFHCYTNPFSCILTFEKCLKNSVAGPA